MPLCVVTLTSNGSLAGCPVFHPILAYSAAENGHDEIHAFALHYISMLCTIYIYRQTEIFLVFYCLYCCSNEGDFFYLGSILCGYYCLIAQY